MNKLVIIGAGENAEIMYEYFTYDSPYEVAAFAVEKEYYDKSRLRHLPVIKLDDINELYPPQAYTAFVAISSHQLNRQRERICNEMKRRGYRLATYISSKASVCHDVKIGDNCLVLENTILQWKVAIGDHTFVWLGSIIGHGSRIGANCSMSTVLIGGNCKIGDCSVIGLGVTFNDNITVGKDTFVASGALVVKNYGDNCFLKGVPAKPEKEGSRERFMK